MTERIDIGNRYGQLTVKTKSGKKGNNVTWLYVCDCGQETEVRADYLKSGKIVSCGCYRLSKFVVTEENVNRAALLFNDGYTIFEISQKMRVSPSNVQKFLTASGIDITISLERLCSYRGSDKDKWCTLYQDWGLSLTEIAVHEKTTVSTVLSALIKNNVETRPQGKPSPRMISDVKARALQYKSLYEQGHTLAEIAQYFDRTNKSIAYLLVSIGCVLRSPEEEVRKQRAKHRKEILGLIEERNVKLSETVRASKLREIEQSFKPS